MTRVRVGALVLCSVLAGCPLPQPLPDYPPGTITPPRILQETVWPKETVVLVGDGCDPASESPEFHLDARVYHTNNLEQVEARWFVNYDETVASTRPPQKTDILPADADPLELERDVPDFVFEPYGYSPPPGTAASGVPPYRDPGTIRVVELLVSNGFFEPREDATPPYRGTSPNFETQLQRWVFVIVAGRVNCGLQPPP